MSKPKRTKEEKIERYKRKLQDLEKTDLRAEIKNKRRRHRLISSEQSDVDQGDSHLQNEVITPPLIDIDQLPAHEILHDPVLEIQADDNPDPISEATPELFAPALDQPAQAADVEPSLDPSLLAALGESTSDTPEFGPDVHDSLANIWLPLLKRGMTKENKEKLLKEYLIPSNCKLLQAPKLNAEILAAVSEVVRGRDKKYVNVQQQLGQGIAAINRAMDIMLKSDNKIETLRYLSDGCRILCDLHHFFTKDRTKLITPSLDKNFLQVIEDAERDEYLFSNALPEKIKASKAIEKQGQQIKKSFSTTKSNTPSTTSVRAYTAQENWSGPPRYSSNRGGRGGNRRTNPPVTRRPYINATAAPTTRAPPVHHKPRAPAHQQ